MAAETPCRVGIIDLGVMGNIRSVGAAFQHIGAHVRIGRTPEDLEDMDAIVLPGVGAFGAGMNALREAGWPPFLEKLVEEEVRPLLGICLGMQLLATESEEYGHHEGLGLIEGVVRRLPEFDESLRIPNIGWCDVNPRSTENGIFGGDVDHCYYFAHSYHLEGRDEDVLATLEFGCPITVAVRKGPVFGVQFHPEKSLESGLELLNCFVEGHTDRIREGAE